MLPYLYIGLGALAFKLISGYLLAQSEPLFFVFIVMMMIVGFLSGTYEKTRVRILLAHNGVKVQIKEWWHFVWQDAAIFKPETQYIDKSLSLIQRAELFVRNLEHSGAELLYIKDVDAIDRGK